MAKYFKNLTNDQFSIFETTLVARVTADGAGWGISTAEITALTAQSTAYNVLWDAAKQKRNRTQEQVDDHQAGRIAYEDYIDGFAKQHLLGNPAISDSQIRSMGFNRRTDTNSPRPAITATVFAKMVSLTSQQVQFICRTDSDASRASILKDADGVEVRYVVGSAPSGVSACPHVEFSTRARFVLQLDESAQGQKIYAFARWRNNTDAAKSGPWSDMLVVLVN